MLALRSVDLADTVSWVCPPLPAKTHIILDFTSKCRSWWCFFFFFQEKHNWLQLRMGWVITVLFFSNFIIDLRRPHATSIWTIIYDQQQETAKFKHWYRLGLSKFRLQGHNLKIISFPLEFISLDSIFEYDSIKIKERLPCFCGNWMFKLFLFGHVQRKKAVVSAVLFCCHGAALWQCRIVLLFPCWPSSLPTECGFLWVCRLLGSRSYQSHVGSML